MTGYVMNEKVEIAKQYLMPKAQSDTGLEPHQAFPICDFPPTALCGA
jgi:ATP-dependent Lon protease